MIELLATALLTYISGQFGISITQAEIKFVMAYVGFFNTVLLAIFIYATIPGSGGHLNPLITFTTFLCGLCPAPRGKGFPCSRCLLPYGLVPALTFILELAILYICAQTLGGALAGGMLLASWGQERGEM